MTCQVSDPHTSNIMSMGLDLSGITTLVLSLFYSSMLQEVGLSTHFTSPRTPARSHSVIPHLPHGSSFNNSIGSLLSKTALPESPIYSYLITVEFTLMKQPAKEDKKQPYRVQREKLRLSLIYLGEKNPLKT